jgi:segregation and condensation protein B
MAEGQEPESADLVLRIEALLFAAGKPLTVHDLAASLGLSDWALVMKGLKKLHHNYTSRQTALELRKAGDGWAIQVRKEYLPVAYSVAATDISRGELKTLALIAYHQPVRQSRLVKMVGDRVYQDIPRLRELGFIRGSEKANTLELTTTSKFAEYFGFETTDKQKLKKFLKTGLGIEDITAPEEPPKEETVKESPPEDGSGEKEPTGEEKPQ